ncbi:MAG: pirin family protein [Hyphomicrobiales bacterium]
MSWHPSDDPKPGDKFACDAIETIIVPRARDLGGFEVRRALPSAKKQMIGPFIFFDQMGPAEFITNEGIDVRPHPHIGLSTVTYLFEGEIYHRDSLGTELPIAPGEVNWMTAGKGIVHSERTSEENRKIGQNLFGIQTWVAMPKKYEEVDPRFEHQSANALPVLADNGASVRVIVGDMYGQKSPVKTYSDMFYATVDLLPGAVVPLDAEHEERGIYVVSGEIDISGDTFQAGQLLVFKPGDRLSARGVSHARLMLLGGEPMDGPRHIWWNFVSSSKERIEQAKEDWRRARFDIVPGDEEEFIPLPE